MLKIDALTDAGHFVYGEFWGASQDGRTRTVEPPAEYLDDLRHLAEQLEEVRSAALWMYGKPSSSVAVIITPHGGWRAPWQKAAPKSMHYVGKAADIVVKVDGHTVPPGAVKRLIEGLIALGKVDDGGIGLYSEDGFVHYDTGKPRRWVG